ncbi:serine/threonine-protein kinase [Crateriforma conspicua]|uniref:non-specific serine/threonine protein kinase n=1 Tax=Crateriforma conspicua TaxID=2527996 RepID=A0A5C6FXK3_9PLAN|nr:serine/threonine-protein kinase [Crateriforma conspicua]TWU67649.1 Serine/threonine-protein kinase PknB [Crateriforma conspicua]
MIARFHYDREQLRAFLDGQDEGGSEMQTHLESCEDCQAELESLAESDFDWNEASELLGDDLLSERRQPSSALAIITNAPEGLRPSATFLDPTDNSNSIGRFARYEIREIIGRGGMGIVMRAFDPSLNRLCAVKVLAPELASSAAAKKRFSREAKSAAAVVHPHVVPIQTVNQHEGLPYLVMPVVEGQSLQQRVEADGPLSVIETVRIASQIAEGLAAAHDQGLVHRDIKPANILLENGVERVQITDFGLARAVDDASMTRSGVIAGTPQYMSPEQAHGDSIDHRSDLFSLGSVIYFMLTGRSPFRAETTMGVLNRIGNDDPRPLRSVNAEVPEWLEAFVSRLLAKAPDKRFTSAGDVADLLQSWHAHLQSPDRVDPPVVDETTSPSAPSTKGGSKDSSPRPLPKLSGLPPIARWLIALAAFGFFALLGGVIYLETNNGTLRIETNSDGEIPVRIIQNDETIEELTITSAGLTKRLKVGDYVIEIDDADSQFTITGDEVKIERGGTWLARISQLDQAQSLLGQWRLIGWFTADGAAASEKTDHTTMSIDSSYIVSVTDGVTPDDRFFYRRLSNSVLHLIETSDDFAGGTESKVRYSFPEEDLLRLGNVSSDSDIEGLYSEWRRIEARSRSDAHRTVEKNRPVATDPTAL